MLASPFTFYRGAAILMAADLATQRDTGLRVQACGDAHLANFGGFMAPDRRIVFDMNDFDETAPGPFEWDVKRLVTSFELACARERVLTPRRAARSWSTPRRRTATAMPRLRRDGQPRALVLAARRRRGAHTVGSRPLAGCAGPLPPQRRQGPGEEQPQGAEQAHRGGRRAAPDQVRPAADRARPRHRRRMPTPWSAGCRSASASTATASNPIGATCSRATGSSTWPGRSWGWAASGPGAGSSCSWAATTRTRSSSR